jgi:hypothetical protein
VFPPKDKVRIVLSILAGEVTVAEAARRAKISGQSGSPLGDPADHDLRHSHADGVDDRDLHAVPDMCLKYPDTRLRQSGPTAVCGSSRGPGLVMRPASPETPAWYRASPALHAIHHAGSA